MSTTAEQMGKKMGTRPLPNPSETLIQAEPESLKRLGKIAPSFCCASGNLWLDKRILSLHVQ